MEQNYFNDDINGDDSNNENDMDLNDTNDKVIFYQILHDHFLYHYHHVTLLDEKRGWVQNFVGDAISRSDCGDREYYCSTMLAFCKPWWTGNDLKSKDQ